MQRVGATEAEREQIIAAIRAGKSFKDATAPFRSIVEAEWFERNEKHLLEVAEKGEKKAPLVDAASAVPTKDAKK